MPSSPHSFLIDLLAAHEQAACHGCGLEPRLLELLLDRHGQRPDVIPFPRVACSDGPAQNAPNDWPHVAALHDAQKGASHVRR